jgi:hypothetical protein
LFPAGKILPAPAQKFTGITVAKTSGIIHIKLTEIPGAVPNLNAMSILTLELMIQVIIA